MGHTYALSAAKAESRRCRGGAAARGEGAGRGEGASQPRARYTGQGAVHAACSPAGGPMRAAVHAPRLPHAGAHCATPRRAQARLGDRGPGTHGPADPEPAPWPPCARMDSSTGQASPRSRRRMRPRPREFLFARALSRRRHRAPRAPPPVDPIYIAELPYEEPTSTNFPAARAVAVSLRPKGRRARALRARAFFFLDI